MASTQELAAVLGADASSFAVLERHSDAEVDQLLGWVRSALQADDRSVEEGMAQTLRFVPGLLRGPAKKLLFGGR